MPIHCECFAFGFKMGPMSALHSHPSSDAKPALTLDQLPVRTMATIRTVHAGPGSHHQALRRRLMELGFVPGERVQVLRRVFFGHGPAAVRVGTSTFAMRRLESSLIEVVPA